MNPKQKFELLVPEGFELNANKVVAGVYSTSVIDQKGELKFWSNRQNDLPENVMTFQGFSDGKMSLSERFFCAINDSQELNCYEISNTPTSTSINKKKLILPPALKGEVKDVSAGNDQICAITARSAVICWTYIRSKVHILDVPHYLSNPKSALRVHAGQGYHCAIGTDAILNCWGLLDGRKNKEET